MINKNTPYFKHNNTTPNIKISIKNLNTEEKVIQREEGRYKVYNNIGLIVIILGVINIYNIIKYGSIVSLPTISSTATAVDIVSNPWINLKEGLGGSIIISRGSMIVGIISIIIIKTIFNITSLSRINDKEEVSDKSISNNKKEGVIEYEILIGLGLIGLLGIILSNELITMYLSIELYSFTTYILILVKESNIIRRLSIIYLITSSIASGLILIAIYLLYKYYGVVDLETLNIISSFKTLEGREEIIIGLLIIAILFKIGAYPFYNILLRVYADLEKRILLYQLTIPKMIMVLLLLKFLSIFNSFSTNFYLLFIVSILSIIVGSIAPLYHNRDNILLSYSSLLNIGYILLSISILLFTSSLIKGINNIQSIWIIYEYMLIYIFNVLGLFSGIFLAYKSSIVYNLRNFYMFPYYYLCMFILIASFIGIPPFNGFFIKFHLMFILFDYSFISIFSLLLLIISSLFSSILYLKFLFSSTSSPSFQPSILPETSISLASYILAITSLFSFFYPLFISILFPFFSFIN